MRNKIVSLLLMSLLMIAANICLAQSGNQGSIEGTITDSSGAAVAGAKVILTNEATSIAFTTSSGSEGIFKFPVLPVGSYSIAVNHASFAEVSLKNVTVTVGAKINLPLIMGI